MAQASRTSIQLAIGDSNINCGNITDSYNNIIYESHSDAQILRWLSPLEPVNRHQALRINRLEGIGEWFLETSEFREWRGGEGGADKSVLFCSGNPGVGKTLLSSLVIDRLCDQPKDVPVAVAYLYCDYLAQNEQSITNVVGAILKQLVGGGGIPNDIREAFQKGKKELGGRGPPLAYLMRMLKAAIDSLPQVFICIDALDECLPRNLPELLESLSDILRESPTTRIFLTGRPHVGEEIQRYSTTAVVIPISPNTGDVRNYLHMKLDQDVVPEAMSDSLRADIIRIILEKTSDIFLLVSLHIEAILGEVTICQRRKKLGEMTRGNGLSDAYTATLTRLKSQKGYKSALGLKVLMWVLYSERPLRAQELCHAIGVEMGSSDPDPDNIPQLRTLLASCLGLVTVEASSSTVRLVHFTLQEHLSSDPTLFHSSHSTIAEVCLTYLNFRCVRDLSPTLLSAPATMPLLEYASSYWVKHASKGMTGNVKILALRFLGGFDEHISAQLILRHNKVRGSGPYLDVVGELLGFLRLHGVASPGAVGIFAILVMIEWGASTADITGSTAPIRAARGSHEVAEALLELKDVNLDLVDSSGRTPLSWAARAGCEMAVKVLLERKDVNPDQVDYSGRTPLSWAAGGRCEGVVKVLLERKNVNPNRVDSSGRTPLSWAAGIGYEGAVKALLKRKDVNPNLADFNGRTPLSWAAENGCEGAVKALLGREDVKPDLADSNGRTPLLWTTLGRHERMAKLFLERRYFVPDPAPLVSLRIVFDVCFFIIALLFLSYLLPIL